MEHTRHRNFPSVEDLHQSQWAPRHKEAVGDDGVHAQASWLLPAATSSGIVGYESDNCMRFPQ